MKKVRKSLERKWSTPGDVNLSADLVLPETPVCALFLSSSRFISNDSNSNNSCGLLLVKNLYKLNC